MPRVQTNTKSWSITPTSNSPLSAFRPWAINPTIQLLSWVVPWSRNTVKRFVSFEATSARPTGEFRIFCHEFWAPIVRVCLPNPLSWTGMVWPEPPPCPEMAMSLPLKSLNPRGWHRESCITPQVTVEPPQAFFMSRMWAYPRPTTRKWSLWPRLRNCCGLP